jgi:hypothetical protein
VTDSSASFPHRFLDWLLCRPGLAEARKAAERTPHEKVMTERAASALTAANHIAEVPHSAEMGTARHATVLALEAVYWTFLSSRPDLVDADASALWEASAEPIRELGLPERETKDLDRVLAMKRPAMDLAGLSENEQIQLSKTLLRVAESAISAANRRQRAATVMALKRFARVALTLGSLVALVVSLVVLKPKPKLVDPNDLAVGKTWTTSSKMYDCDPVAGTCGGAATKILFHTNEEDKPWVEYDLGEPMAFKGVTVRNCQEVFFQERAVPLIVEVSDDGKTYREIARRDESFAVWQPDITPQRARFVRLRAMKRTYLHLEGVQIRP